MQATKKLSDGIEIPYLGLGTWKLKEKECLHSVEMALKMGYRHIDTAAIYENEEEVGKGIQHFPREQLFVTSKLWFDVQDPRDVEKACAASLSRLKTSYLDLYLLHWPNRKTFISLVKAMMRLKEAGKARTIGVSNMTIHHLQDLLDHGLTVTVNQVEFHPFLYQKELLAFCNQHKITLTAYCPLARGKVYENAALINIGKAHSTTAGVVALRWLLQKGIVAIPKASSPTHLKENLESLSFEQAAQAQSRPLKEGVLQLSEAEMDQIDHLDQNLRLGVLSWSEFDY